MQHREKANGQADTQRHPQPGAQPRECRVVGEEPVTQGRDIHGHAVFPLDPLFSNDKIAKVV